MIFSMAGGPFAVFQLHKTSSEFISRGQPTPECFKREKIVHHQGYTNTLIVDRDKVYFGLIVLVQVSGGGHSRVKTAVSYVYSIFSHSTESPRGWS